MPIHRVRICKCGHEEGTHDDRGCRYGFGSVHGECECDRFRSRGHAGHRTVSATPKPTTALGALKSAAEFLNLAIALLEKTPVEAALPPKKERATVARIAGELHGVKDASKLTRCEAAILSTVARFGDDYPSAVKVAIFTGYSATSGGFTGALAGLRKRGLLAGDGGALAITDAGKRRPEVASSHAMPTGRTLLELWRSKLDKCSGTILEELQERYPARCSAADIASRRGYSVTSGGFTGSLAKLRALELIDGSGQALRINPAFAGGA